jgi:hypothetical protein
VVPGRGAHRPEGQDHAPLSQARHPSQQLVRRRQFPGPIVGADRYLIWCLPAVDFWRGRDAGVGKPGSDHRSFVKFASVPAPFSQHALYSVFLYSQWDHD